MLRHGSLHRRAGSGFCSVSRCEALQSEAPDLHAIFHLSARQLQPSADGSLGIEGAMKKLAFVALAFALILGGTTAEALRQFQHAEQLTQEVGPDSGWSITETGASPGWSITPAHAHMW
jgi:hypothetical protein